MALAFKSSAIIVAFGTVSFFMVDDETTIRVDIDKEVLARIVGPAPRSKNDYIEQCARNRRYFAQIAALKYFDGLWKSDVNVLVVQITADDLL